MADKGLSEENKMKIEKTKNSIFFEWKNGFIIDIWENLSEIIFWKRFNWNTWQFINIEFENDIRMGGYEFTFVFLCCGIRIRIPHETKKSKKQWNRINKSMKKIYQSCYGYVSKDNYKEYRKKEGKVSQLIVYKENTGFLPKKSKKIFIQ